MFTYYANAYKLVVLCMVLHKRYFLCVNVCKSIYCVIYIYLIHGFTQHSKIAENLSIMKLFTHVTRLRKADFNTQNSGTHFSSSHGSCVHQLTVQASIVICYANYS